MYALSVVSLLDVLSVVPLVSESFTHLNTKSSLSYETVRATKE
jgi:hypothetical protein